VVLAHQVADDAVRVVEQQALHAAVSLRLPVRDGHEKPPPGVGCRGPGPGRGGGQVGQLARSPPGNPDFVGAGRFFALPRLGQRGGQAVATGPGQYPGNACPPLAKRTTSSAIPRVNRSTVACSADTRTGRAPAAPSCSEAIPPASATSSGGT